MRFFRGLLHHTVQFGEIENDQQPLWCKYPSFIDTVLYSTVRYGAVRYGINKNALAFS